MGKEETAKWLAESVLDKTVLPTVEVENGSGRLGTMYKRIPMDTEELTDFIYSPDGFFAVWDAVEEKDLEISINRFKHGTLGEISYAVNIGVIINSNTPLSVKGKDRYEAFYSAVKEAWVE